MICFLDLGTSKVSGLLIDDLSNSTVHAFSSIETSGVKKGSIINISATASSISECLRDIENQSGFKIKEVLVSISGEEVSSTNSIGQAAISEREVSARDIENALNMSSTMKIPNDKTLLYAMPNNYFIDGQGDISDPLGMNGIKLEARSHLIHCSKNTKDNIKKCIKVSSSVIGIRKYFYSQLGVAQSVLTENQKKLGVCLLDIGAGTTDISVYQNGSITFSKVLPYSGDYITETIASALDIQSIEAEIIKKKYGCAFSDYINDEMLKISLKNGKKSISRKALSELIENSMSKILRHCMNCLEENNLFNYIPAGIVITGGSANMEGMVKLGEKLTNLKVKIGIPKYNLPQKSDNLLKPENSAILGITKFYALEQDKEFTFNQSKGIIARVLEWIRTEL
ncbi:cell division protein FtsA [Gammaproteobacteria bacterium]|jgi:cell division protein FtsA|nr:cell division protein FtsA [Gammaproteobacteria bacterium]|tara:strand:- start:655 stop:1848 length:1194 start_codon:yes stop_codon:yes gene_type:complete